MNHKIQTLEFKNVIHRVEKNMHNLIYYHTYIMVVYGSDREKQFNRKMFKICFCSQ